MLLKGFVTGRLWKFQSPTVLGGKLVICLAFGNWVLSEIVVNPGKSVETFVSVSAVQLGGFGEPQFLYIHPGPTPVQLCRFVADMCRYSIRKIYSGNVHSLIFCLLVQTLYASCMYLRYDDSSMYNSSAFDAPSACHLRMATVIVNAVCMYRAYRLAAWF